MKKIFDGYPSDLEYDEYEDDKSISSLNSICFIFQKGQTQSNFNIQFNDNENEDIIPPYFWSKCLSVSNGFRNNEMSISRSRQITPFLPTENKLSSNDNKIIFKITNKELCGRKRKKNNKYYKIHDKNSKDNIIRKITVNYFQFIIFFLNSYIQCSNLGTNENYEFKKFDYKYIKVINKQRILDNMSRTISQLIKDIPISRKNKKFDKEHNKKLVKYYSEMSGTIKNILEGNFLSLFPVYYKSKREINLNEFGKNSELILSDNVKLYKDLINKGDNSKEDYIKECEKIINRWFLTKKK